ncbi:MAG: MerR family transcriptional regulator [Breznakia sp.]
MEYSVLEVSKILKVSVYTLRYYDKINLLKPKRKRNNYRYYTNEDILKYKYIEVMKYAGMSLKDIKVIMRNKGNRKEHPYYENLEHSLDIINKKIKDSEVLLESLESNIKILKHSKNILFEKRVDRIKGEIKIDTLVEKQFALLRREIDENTLF